MNIQAIFTDGATELTVHGLSRWDYGRILELHHPDLPAVLEVHFAAVGDVEAIVRAVAGINGVAEAAIPDTLLEQTRPILAWAYVIGETSGETMLTVVLPLKDRARPTPAAPIPEEVGDKYTEAVAAVNAQVAALKAGNVTVANALKADHAETAGGATHDGDGRNIASTYVPKITPFTLVTDLEHFEGGANWVHLFHLTVDLTVSADTDTYSWTALCAIPEASDCVSVLFGTAVKDGTTYLIEMDVSGSFLYVYGEALDGSGIWEIQNEDSFALSYCPVFALPVG